MVSAGFRAHKAVFPSFHLFGPLLPVIGLQGDIVAYTQKAYPRGPGKTCRAPPDFAEFELPNEIRVDLILPIVAVSTPSSQL